MVENMQTDSIFILKTLKYAAMAFGTLLFAGIVTLMFIAWDKDEDITGIVAPALVLIFALVVVAIVAAVMQKRLSSAGN